MGKSNEHGMAWVEKATRSGIKQQQQPCPADAAAGVESAAQRARREDVQHEGKALGHGRSVRAVGREQAGAPQHTRLARWWRTTTQRDALGETMTN